MNKASLPRLRKRAEFLAARAGVRANRRLVAIEARARGDDAPPRVGFTATKRLGGAVARNRAKRRLRAAAQALLPEHARIGCDYVLIARDGVGDAPWPALLDDVRSALIRLRAALEGASDAPKPVRGARPEEGGRG
ncbi:MAG: ribonuclease P protein component [Hyphomonadaceae bacterium]